MKAPWLDVLAFPPVDRHSKQVKILAAALLLHISGLLLWAQPSAKYSIKSWKTGTAQAQTQTLHISLNTSHSSYRKLIDDVSGAPLYRLLVQPASFIGPADGIIAWHVYLTALDSNSNLLTPSPTLEQEEYETPDYLWWFYPGKNTFVPMEATRVIQVQGSYVVLQAKDVKVNGSGQLEGMQLTITFANHPPAVD